MMQSKPGHEGLRKKRLLGAAGGIALAVLAPLTAMQPAAAQAAAPAGEVVQAGTACDAANPQQVRLRIDVSAIHSNKGVVTATVYPDDSAHFLNGNYKIARVTAPVTLPVTHLCVAVPASGIYAVALFHDENDNGHFDTTMLGLPAEGYGFSRNPTLLVGPPKLDQTRMAVRPGDNLIAITMKYF